MPRSQHSVSVIAARERLLPRVNIEMLSEDESTARNHRHQSQQMLVLPNEIDPQQILKVAGKILNACDGAIRELEENRLLGTAIVRGAHDLATYAGNLAHQIEELSSEEERELAQACLKDANEVLKLEREARRELAHGYSKDANGGLDAERTAGQEEQKVEKPPNQQMKSTCSSSLQQYTEQEDDARLQSLGILEDFVNLSEEDLINALNATAEFLRDVESSLNSIEKDEAEDIADVALTAAGLFVASLQEMHYSIAQDSESDFDQSWESSPKYEILEETSHKDGSKINVLPSSTSQKKQSKRKDDRLRLLWPPLGDAVLHVLGWGKDAAIQRPILAVALGITLWPAAVLTTVIGTPIVITDCILQSIYNSPIVQEFPFVVGSEKVAAQAFQTSKLFFLTAKLLGKQGLRVAHKQIDRHGGPGKVVENIRGFCVDRITHPVDTIQQTWNGLAWCTETVVHAVQKHLEESSERTTTAQELLQ